LEKKDAGTNEIIIVTFLRNPPLPTLSRWENKGSFRKGKKVRGKAVSLFHAFVFV
jgi:hypothetical protein